MIGNESEAVGIISYEEISSKWIVSSIFPTKFLCEGPKMVEEEISRRSSVEANEPAEY